MQETGMLNNKQLHLTRELSLLAIGSFFTEIERQNNDLQLTVEQWEAVRKLQSESDYFVEDLKYGLVNMFIDFKADMYKDWRNENHKLTELYRSVAIQNAANNNQPQVVADNVVEAYKEKFNLNKKK